MSGGRRMGNVRAKLAEAQRERLLLARWIVHETDCGQVTAGLEDMTTTERRESLMLARQIVEAAWAREVTPGAGT